jgi:hypothetical protein
MGDILTKGVKEAITPVRAYPASKVVKFEQGKIAF